MSPNVSFPTFQTFVRGCFGRVNGINYSNSQLASKIQRYATIATKAVRKEKIVAVGPNLAMCSAWVVALANNFDLVFDSDEGGAIWRRFPGVCPYCGTAPCSCKERRSKRITDDPEIKIGIKSDSLVSVKSFQRMFREIYPANGKIDTCLHLLEEVSELMEAIQNYNSIHSLVEFDNIIQELVDVVANILRRCIYLFDRSCG